MKPLSMFYYSSKNIKKILTMVLSIGLSVALIYSLQFLVDEIKHAGAFTTLNPHRSYSEIIRKTEEPIPKEIIEDILQDEATEKVIPRLYEQTFYQPIAGRNTVGLYALKQEDLNLMMEKLDLKLIEGRMPAAESNEIIMDVYLAKNKGIDIGDYIGYDVNEKENQITGKHQVVGFLEGESMVMLTNRQDKTIDEELLSYGMIVFHREGFMRESNAFLQTLPNKLVEISSYKVLTDAMAIDSEDIKKYMNILVVLLIVVLSISIGNASYINTYQRRYEFGLLYSIGYSEGQILKKATLEIFFAAILGLLSGVVLTGMIAAIQYLVIFRPNGLILRLFLPDAMLQTLAIPLFTSLFSVIPVSRMLKKIDPICIIEGAQ